jgi:hypothetical protein
LQLRNDSFYKLSTHLPVDVAFAIGEMPYVCLCRLVFLLLFRSSLPTANVRSFVNICSNERERERERERASEKEQFVKWIGRNLRYRVSMGAVRLKWGPRPIPLAARRESTALDIWNINSVER